MAFRLRANEYFRGSIIEPTGDRRDLVVVDKSTRASAVKSTVVAAGSRGWDWDFRLLRDEQDGTVTELAHWSEIQGDDLPPLTRAEVPGLR